MTVKKSKTKEVKNMTKMVVGLFQNENSAQDAIETFRDEGYSPKDMSIILKDTVTGERIASNTGTIVAEGTISGLTTGAVLGGVAGLLIGIGALTIPGIGAFLIGGPLASNLGFTGATATTASGAATGAVAGGLIGALMGLGLPRKEAQAYEQEIKQGAILLTVPVAPGNVDYVIQIMEDTGATQLKTVNVPTRTLESREVYDENESTSPYAVSDKDDMGGMRYGKNGRSSVYAKTNKNTRIQEEKTPLKKPSLNV